MDFNDEDFTEVGGELNNPLALLNNLDNKPRKKKSIHKKKKLTFLYKEKYTHDTLEYYKAMRVQKMDPITTELLTDENAFKFSYMWNPYTGERDDKDPYGPLYFNPVSLIKYFYESRYRKLWVEPSETEEGYYEGYYDDGVGAGSEFYIKSRGVNPHWYVFRLPIPNCYLIEDNYTSAVTMGPILTNEEIMEIEEKAKLWGNYYRENYRKNKPSLIEMKKLYDLAISKNPLSHEKNATEEQQMIINRKAVDKLVKMKG